MFMPITGTPRVEIRERESESPITGSDSVSAALFIGQTAAGPGFQVTSRDGAQPPRPIRVVSWNEYVQKFGRPLPGGTGFQADVPGAYVSHAVRGFFDNGGKQAWILRLTTEVSARWEVANTDGDVVFAVRAGGGATANPLRLLLETEANSAITLRVPVAATVAGPNSTDPTAIDLTNLVDLAKGDRICAVKADGTIGGTATIVEVTGNRCTVHPPLPVEATDTVRLAAQKKELSASDPPATFRMPTTSRATLAPGTLVELVETPAGPAPVLWGVVERVENTAILITRVTADLDFYQANGAVRTLGLKPHSYKLSVSDSTSPTVPEPLANLVLDKVSPVASSPRFLGTLLAAAYTDGSNRLRVPLTVDLLKVMNTEPSLWQLVLATSPAAAAGRPPDTNGVDDVIGALSINDYQEATDTLADFEYAKLIVAPDTAVHPLGGAVQQLLRDHCQARGDRFVLLDAPEGVHARDDLIQRAQDVRSDGGFAALYYPWIKIAAPRGRRDPFMFVPPSGHIAGMYARVDARDGVHKSPANETLRGALDVQNRLGDVSQGPLHEAGVNVLRVFQGNAAVNVFGGRTTAPATKLDFRYIAVRRLFLFVEDALKRSLREKLYEPNEPGLWKVLTRDISEFLSRVQSSGALFATDDEPGFFVHIGEDNNPPSQRAAGILNIQIGLRPSYPAEYIIVDIGIWNNQVTIQEA